MPKNNLPIRDIDGFYAGVQPYVTLFDVFARKHALIGRTEPDHICYKCGSRESFERMREIFESASEYVYQSIISGRRIAIVKLQKPVATALGPVWFVELSDQKPDGSQADSYDHIEVFPKAMSYEEMIEELSKSETIVKVERPHHTTHDIDIGDGFLFRCTRELLIHKIKRTEMV